MQGKWKTTIIFGLTILIDYYFFYPIICLMCPMFFLLKFYLFEFCNLNDIVGIFGLWNLKIVKPRKCVVINIKGFCWLSYDPCKNLLSKFRNCMIDHSDHDIIKHPLTKIWERKWKNWWEVKKDENVEACKAIYNHRVILHCNCSQMKCLQCLNRSKMHKRHHKLSKPLV